MKSLIYYPYFEVQDTNWLKFATIYIGNLTSIIPNAGKSNISDDFLQLVEEGKFITNKDSYTLFRGDATKVAIKEVNNFFSDSSILDTGISIDYLKNKENHQYEIFDQKFSPKWLRFCLDNNLGYETDNGVRVAKEVAYIYMHSLAKIIGDREGKEPVTDSQQAREFLADLFPENRGLNLMKAERTLFAREIIELKLPEKIEKIRVGELLDLRKDKSFLEKQAAFHETLNLYLDNSEEDYKYAYLDSLVEMEKEIKRWLPLSFGVVSTGVQILLQDNLPSYVPPVLGSLIPTLIPASGPNELNLTKKKSRQFLTDISKINRG